MLYINVKSHKVSAIYTVLLLNCNNETNMTTYSIIIFHVGRKQCPIKFSVYQVSHLSLSYCCRKTAVCNGDQLLDFSVPELVWSLSTFSTDPEVLQNCTGFTLCISTGLAVGECSAVMGLTPCMLCVQIYCVLCVLDYYLLNFLTVNTGLGRPMFWKSLCLLRTLEGLAPTNFQLTYNT